MKTFLQLVLQKKYKGGFSIIELMVVVSMMLVIMGIILANNTGSRQRLLVVNEAYDLALAFREVQQYGVGTRESDSGSNPFDYAYGIRFNNNDLTKYELFVDLNDNLKSDGGSELLRTEPLPGGYVIDRFCGVSSGGVETCSPSINSLDVSFKRPEPDARIEGPSASYSSANIYLRSANGEYEAGVSVTITGQVSVIPL